MNDSKHNRRSDHEDRGHEVNEVKVGGITWFLIVLTVSVVFIAWLIVAVLNTLEGRERKAELESRPSPFASERPKLPPEPRLQLAPNSEEQIDKLEPPNLKTQHPLEEMKDLRDSWDKQLNSYGWVDQKTGVVRIPIDQAKKLILERGLPTRSTTKAESSQASGGVPQQ